MAWQEITTTAMDEPLALDGEARYASARKICLALLAPWHCGGMGV